MAQSPGGEPAELAGAAVEVVSRPHSYAVTWQPRAGRRKRGLGLRDEDGLLDVSVDTGGAAYGSAIFHQVAGHWEAQSISSIDAGNSPVQLSFQAGADLAGSHPLVCSRRGFGTLHGVVRIAPLGPHYVLTFTSGHMTLYHAIAELAPGGDRLICAWSFGSSPALVWYQGDGDSLTGKRLSARSGQAVETVENLVRPSAAPNLPSPLGAASGVSGEMPEDGSVAGLPEGGLRDELPAPSAEAGNAARLITGIDAANVKAWTYGGWRRQHQRRGRAVALSDAQLTPAEHAFLEAAAARYRHGSREQRKMLDSRTVSALIDEERSLGSRH